MYRHWRRLDDEQLLDLRFCDLPLDIHRGQIARQMSRLYAELRARGIRFRPHVWYGTEWFSPDGVPGFAVPFYLADPRLKRLERRIMQQVEGGDQKWLRRILRHEAGHALDTAYDLRHRRDWREVFGPAWERSPSVSTAGPGSRRYVLHLGHWYAQSHPTEDFAETFAVWLKSKRGWRSKYNGWPALEKLMVVDEWMNERRKLEPVITG